jgi:two-component sensor histidine kinase
MTPVRAKDPIAAIGAYWAVGQTPSPDTVIKLETMARATAAAIENARLYASLNEALERRTFLLRELDHRVKNTLASVQSIARQTLRTAPSPADFADSFESRLMGLSRAHELLTRQAWGRTDLRDVLEAALQPFGGLADPRFTARGPAIALTPETAVAVHMTLHELMVNAAKHGALTAASGQVTVVWRLEEVNGRPGLSLEWVERGGPPVFAPKRQGFGTRLLERGVARDLGGEASLSYQPKGLTYVLRVPLSDRISATGRRHGVEDAGMTAPRNAPRIMIVEDEALVALMVEDLLTDFGCQISGSFGAVDEALAYLRRRGRAAAGPGRGGAGRQYRRDHGVSGRRAPAGRRHSVRVRHRLRRPAPQGLRGRRGAEQADQSRAAEGRGRGVRQGGLIVLLARGEKASWFWPRRPTPAA